MAQTCPPHHGPFRLSDLSSKRSWMGRPNQKIRQGRISPGAPHLNPWSTGRDILMAPREDALTEASRGGRLPRDIYNACWEAKSRHGRTQLSWASPRYSKQNIRIRESRNWLWITQTNSGSVVTASEKCQVQLCLFMASLYAPISIKQ